MADPHKIDDMAAALGNRWFPTVTLWNRLEARPRSDDFDRALSAEICDPLWMLTRQLQLGEFTGNDAGSPISAQILMRTTRFTEYQPDSHPVRAFSEDAPLEAVVEQRPLPVAPAPMPLDVRLLAGRQWLRMLAKNVVDLSTEYKQRWPIADPDATSEADAAVAAHLHAWQRVAMVANDAMMDGVAFHRHVVVDGGDPIDGVTVPAGREADVRAEADRFVAWFDRLYLQPDATDDAWKPSSLEYGFRVTAPEGNAQRGYRADEYAHGGLDWHSLDVEPATFPATVNADDPREEDLLSFVPTEVSYEGMPNPRWWAFEDRKTNFGTITPNTTELGTLLFIEFALVYANDWFVLPYTVPAGTIADVGGLVVTNVFGERTWVEAAGRGADRDWQRWAMFVNSTAGDEAVAADTSLVIVPTTPKIQEGDPIEDVTLIRDEQANMVWAVETTIPLPTGRPTPGREAGQQTAAFHEGLATTGGGSPTTPAAEVSYRIMSPVDEQWIPFVPVHVDGSNREVQLQRAAMPRIIDGDTRPVRKIAPRTSVLRHGLDKPVPQHYFVNEEEVTRAGTRVTLSYQRARWYDGQVITWLRARKWTGRVSGGSGLAFDYLVTKQGR